MLTQVTLVIRFLKGNSSTCIVLHCICIMVVILPLPLHNLYMQCNHTVNKLRGHFEFLFNREMLYII